MKNIILLISMLTGGAVLYAQSLGQGQQYLYYERYASAEASLENHLKSQSEDARAWHELTRVYLIQNKDQEASEKLRSAPTSVQDEPMYQVAMGTFLLSQVKKDSAALFFEMALDKTRNKNPEVLAAVAQAHVDQKNGDANYAVELIKKALKRDKNSPALNVLLGDAYKKLNNGSEAFTAYRNAFEENSSYAAAYHKTGDIFLSQKNPELYLEYYNKALTADPKYAPSYYRLYAHYFYQNPAKALQYHNLYAANADLNLENEYELADLYYLNKQYEIAIAKAKTLLEKEGENIKPRLYKLLGYSYSGLNDSATAINYMLEYIAKEADSNIIAKDYESIADLYNNSDQDSLAMVYYTKATELEKNPEVLYSFYQKLSNLAKELRDYSTQAKWLGLYYKDNNKATNVDLFNLGLAYIRAEEYPMADSIFGLYVSKYPEQSFGYYWQARSNVAMDPQIETGIAIPYYQKLVEVLEKDSTNENYKKWMVEAYAYMAAYEANTQKNYKEAVDYFEKVLEVDPENTDAKKYIAILEQSLENKAGK